MLVDRCVSIDLAALEAQKAHERAELELLRAAAEWVDAYLTVRSSPRLRRMSDDEFFAYARAVLASFRRGWVGE